MSSKVTRFAPTPSGFLHLGNLYSFLVTKALAKQKNSKILLRIDDMDHERVRDEYIQDIFDTLEFMDLEYDLGPKNLEDFKSNWSQKVRLENYKEAIARLIQEAKVFACDCSRKTIKERAPDGYYDGFCLDRNLPLDQPETCLRLKISGYQSAYGPTEPYPIIRKKDRFPAYHLCSLIDDFEFSVNMIIRGSDLLSSTATQAGIASSLGKGEEFEATEIIHHDILLDEKGEKLAKSVGALSIQSIRKEGKNPSDLFMILSKMLQWPTAVDNFEDFSNEVTKKMAT